MEAELRIGGPGAAEHGPLLWDWLGGERRLRGRVRWAFDQPTDTSLGADAWIAVALGSGGVGTVLATSLSKWLSRPAKPGLKLKVTNRRSGAQETRTVELELGRVDRRTHSLLAELLAVEEETASEAEGEAASER